MNIVRSRWTHATVVVVAAVGVVLLLWWRGPAWGAVGDVFRAVEWKWVAAAVGLNLLSVLARTLAWRTVIVQAFDPPYPSFMLVFSAFSVGLFANAILPGRIGELARVAVLNRHMKQEGAWARLLGTVFAHRVFDLISVMRADRLRRHQRAHPGLGRHEPDRRRRRGRRALQRRDHRSP